MDQPKPGSNYTVQPGDTIFSIARQAYGSDDRWSEIYNANIQVIGNNPDVLHPEVVLYIPPLAQSCKVKAAGGLYVRAEPKTTANVTHKYHDGDVIRYVKVDHNGENVNGNTNWGIRITYEDYFWMGATDHPGG